MARFSGPCVVTTVVTLTVAALAAGCSGGHPAPSGSTRLPDAAPGRLVRVLGDGTWNMLDRSGPAVRSSVSAPGGLVAAPDSSLVGLQGTAAFPRLFALRPDGRAEPLATPPSGQGGPRRGIPVAAMLSADHYVVALSTGELDVVDRATGALLGSTPLPSRGPSAWAGGFLRQGGRTLLQYGDQWLSVDGLDAGRPRVTASPPPAPGVVASAQDGDGALLLLPDALVRVDGAGGVAGRAPVSLPAEVRDLTVTAAVADGSGGLYVALAVRTAHGFGDSGSVVHVAADGTATVLVTGAKSGQGVDCRDADTPVRDAHLAQPTSLALWQGRLVVADTRCNSVLAIGLTGR